MGEINFALLAVWIPSPDWFSRKLRLFSTRLGEAAAPRGGEWGPCPDFASYTLAIALQLTKITENLSQGNRNALGRSAPIAIRLVDLAIADEGLDWPPGPCRLFFDSGDEVNRRSE